MKIFKIILVCLVLGLVFSFSGCRNPEPSTPLNAPSSEHQKNLAAAASKVAASVVVIDEAAQTLPPEKSKPFINHEKDLVLSLTGSPTAPDLQKAKIRLKEHQEGGIKGTPLEVKKEFEDLRQKTIESGKNNLKDVLTVKKTEAKEERKDESASFLRWGGLGLSVVGLVVGKFISQRLGAWLVGLGLVLLAASILI